MNKFLLATSIAALLYGDCVFAEGNAQRASRNVRNEGASQVAISAYQNALDRLQARLAQAEENERKATEEIKSLKQKLEQMQQEYQESQKIVSDLKQQLREAELRERELQSQIEKLEQKLEQTRVGASAQTEATSNRASSYDRFIQEGGESRFRQYHYVLSGNSHVGQATPTVVNTLSKDSKSWNDISEIRYANDVAYDGLKDPKVILYRNRDNSCYVILRIKDNKHGVVYGLNEKTVETASGSFLVYEISPDVNSFTDDTERLLYVDNTGLYIVTKNDNSVEEVVNRHKEEGAFKFEGSVIKVSAVDGSITLDDEPITEDNFYDNWIQEEKEIERQVLSQVSGFGGGTRIEKEKVKEKRNVLSTRQPDSNEILRNFYPPEGIYAGIYVSKSDRNSERNLVSFSEYFGRDGGRSWADYFINKRIQMTKNMSRQECENLVKNGRFAFILSIYTDKYSQGQLNAYGYTQKVRDAIAAQVKIKGQRTEIGNDNYSVRKIPLPISDMVSSNPYLFKDLDFVKSLKSGFAEASKDYEKTRESDIWLPFEIVKNL